MSDSKKKTRPAPRRRTIRDGDTPAGALSWTTKGEKASALHAWRCGCIHKFGRQSKVLRVLWIMESKVTDEGYAFPGNAALALETGMAIKEVERAIARAERGGAIIRRAALVRGQWRRRIFLNTEISIGYPVKMPGGKMTGKAPRQNAPNHPGNLPGRNTYSNRRTGFRPSATMQASAREAERRERLEAERAAARGNGTRPP